MIPQELLALRHELYAAHTAYLEAWTAYTAVPLLDRTRVAAETCRSTGAVLAPALTVLIAYLEPLQADVERRAELERAKSIQGTLGRELGFITKALGLQAS